MRRAELYARFGPLAVLCFVIATLGFNAVAILSFRDGSLADSVSQALEEMVDEPLVTFLLVLPFVALAALAAEVGKNASAKAAFTYFAALGGLLGWIYFSGYWGAESALEERAASLSVGMIPFSSLVVLLLGAAALGLIARRHRLLNAAALAMAGAIGLAIVVYTIGFNWLRLLLIAPAFLAAALVWLAPSARFLELSVVFAWVWVIGFIGTSILAQAIPDLPSAGMLLLLSLIGCLGALLAILIALGVRYRQRGAP